MDSPIVLTQGRGAEAVSERLKKTAGLVTAALGVLGVSCFSFSFCVNLGFAINIHGAPDGGKYSLLSSPSHAGGLCMDLSFSVPQFTQV